MRAACRRGAVLLLRCAPAALAAAATAAPLAHTHSSPLVRGPLSDPADPPAAAVARSAAVQAATIALTHLLGAANVLAAPDVLAPYGIDRYGTTLSRPPDLVVFPRSTADVVEIVHVCAAVGLPLIARGAGSSLEGHALAPVGGVVVDFTHHMTRILAVRPDDLDVTVQPGMTWGDLNDALAPHRLFFPVDPGPGASLGGMCSCGCSGTLAFKYGTFKANVIALTVVMADGTVVKTRGDSRSRKSVSGLDLTSLFVGAEGTLGVVTELVLRLAPLPVATAVVTAAFPTVRSACTAAATMVARGVPIAAVELLDGPSYRDAMVGVTAHTLAPPGTHSGGSIGISDAASSAGGGVAATPETGVHPRLFIKLAGPSEATCAEAAAAAGAVVAACGGTAFTWAADARGQAELWSARKEVLWAVQAAHAPSGRVVVTTDVCVPLSRIGDLVETMEAASAASRLPVPIYAVGHVGDGNIHHFLVYDPADPVEVAECERLKRVLVELAISMNGTCTGEHGVGMGKLQWVEAELGPGAVGLSRAIKRAFDPAGMLNPGKKIPLAGVDYAGWGHAKVSVGEGERR